MHPLTDLMKMEMALTAEGLQCFVPKRMRLRTTLRGTRVETYPVVEYYIFVRAEYQAIRAFKNKGYKLQFISAIGTKTHATMKVPDKEMEDFIRVSTQEDERVKIYRADEIEIPQGQRIRICGGSLQGVEGPLVRFKGIRDKRLVVTIPGIMAVSTPVENTFIQLL